MAKIILIEDDREILTVVKLILTECGHIVEGSVNGAVLNDIHSIMPQLIILDDWLGLEKGSDLCLKLKSNPATSSIPIILFTAHGDGEQLAKSVNADAFVRKPFDIDALTALVHRLVLYR